MLQQYLPFTVLKRVKLIIDFTLQNRIVATVLTVYGIETNLESQNSVLTNSVATVLTVYGIETTDRY